MTRRDDIRSVPSGASFEHVVERLHGIISARGLTLFADIDHAQNARDAGLTMPKTRVLIFGNAKGGRLTKSLTL